MTPITYAIGDIHGRLDLLDELLDRIEADASHRQAAATIVFTGDYVDRGADSFAVVERLISGPRRSTSTFICLRGNHDDLFVKAVTIGELLPDWAVLLHRHARLSYDQAEEGPRQALQRHADFLAALPLTHDDGTNLFVHAGIRPGVAIADQQHEDLLWIRHEFLDHDRPLPRRVVHGHTIMGDNPVVTPNRVSIDTGAYRSGILTAAVFAGPEPEFLQAVGEPDRGAIVREAILVARMAGRTITPAMQAAYDDYVAGHIDAGLMIERTR